MFIVSLHAKYNYIARIHDSISLWLFSSNFAGGLAVSTLAIVAGASYYGWFKVMLGGRWKCYCCYCYYYYCYSWFDAYYWRKSSSCSAWLWAASTVLILPKWIFAANPLIVREYSSGSIFGWLKWTVTSYLGLEWHHALTFNTDNNVIFRLPLLYPIVPTMPRGYKSQASFFCNQNFLKTLSNFALHRIHFLH